MTLIGTCLMLIFGTIFLVVRGVESEKKTAKSRDELWFAKNHTETIKLYLMSR